MRRLLDTERVMVILSGSSAAFLSREIAAAMRGRAWEVVIHPFSFARGGRRRHHRGAGVRLDAAASPRSRRWRCQFDILMQEGYALTYEDDDPAR